SKVTAIEEAKELATQPLDELIGNLKVYEMILENVGVASKTTKEKVKSLALKAKVTREQTSNDSDSQEGSDEDVDKEEAEAFNLMARNFCKFFSKGNRFGRVMSIWKAFGGNIRDLGSFGEETDETTDLHQHCSRISPQKLETASHITRDAVTNPTTTASC
ncbi:hypothetical protein Tco_0043679, partial [Tanacetum coccineum]